MIVRLLLAISFLLSPQFSFAGDGNAFLSGNDLFRRCTEKPAGDDILFCQGYVAGLSDTLEALGAICSQEHVTLGQTIDVVVKSLHEHPESRHLAAASLATNALAGAFACKTPQSKP